jgi:hypothetical protein
VSVATELDAIYQGRGQLTPRVVVDVARDPGHPLHTQFEWDDSVAGEKYRQTQAAQLIRSVRVVEPVGDRDQVRVRAWHSVPRPDGRTYVPAEDVRQDEFTRQLVLQAAEREWRALYARYKHLDAFLAVVRQDLAG